MKIFCKLPAERRLFTNIFILKLSILTLLSFYNLRPFHALIFACQGSFCIFLMNCGGILTKIKTKNLQNCQKPVFTVELQTMVKQRLRLCSPLTEYCREEFEKFTTLLTPKKCRKWPVFGCNWPIFRVKKVVLVFSYDRYTSAVIG